MSRRRAGGPAAAAHPRAGRSRRPWPALGLGSAAATALADRLERGGHVERHPRADDRRRLQLVPTTHAGRELGRALDPLLERLDGVEDELSADARTAVQAYLEAVVEAYRSYSEPRQPPTP